MADLATLGIAVDSRPVSSATSELDKLSAAAKKAEGATNEIGRASEGASRSHSRVAAEVAKAERAQRDYDRAVRLANGGLTEHQRRALEAARANDNFSNAADRAARSAGGFEQAVSLAKRALGALGISLGVQQLVAYADGWSDMQSRVGAAVKNMEAAPLLMQRIVDIANASYSPLNLTVEVFARNVSVLRDMGYSASDAADFTEALNNALVLTATRGQRAESVQSALAKAMAVGKLEADGLETVLVNGDAVAQSLAASLGTTTNGLRAMASEGKITGAVIADSIISNFDDFQARAQEMPATIGDAFVRLGTNLSAFIGQLDQTSGASGRVATTLLAVADSIDLIARGAAVAGIAVTSAFAPAILAGIATGFTTVGTAGVAAMTAITAAVAANPIGALAVAITTTIAAFYFFRDEIADLLGVDLVEVARKAANEFIGLFVGAYEGVKSAWGNLPNFMSGVAKEAWNALIAEFEQPLLTANGITLIPGLDLSSLRKQTSEVERMAMESTIVAFTEGFRAEYIPAAEAAAAATRTAEDAAADLNAILGETPDMAGAAAAGIDGATQSTKELERAAREAEAAQRALFAEADRAVARFFPMETAAAEAERLGAIVRDTTNGLTGLQRSALTMQIDENFRRASEQASRASGSVVAFRDTAVGSAQSIGDAFIQNVGDVFSDIFSKATADGESFFDSILRGFAGLGSQLAAAGAQNLFGSLFGMPSSGQMQSAAGIGSFPLAANDNSVATMRTVGALNDNLRQSSRSALDVARAFNGLTEKADAPVLDSFMQASGTWNNLSAKDTAWCAAFANAAIVQAGGRGTGSNLASSFMGWGQGTNAPQVGDIVVLKPQSAGASGHVGFVAGFGDGKVQVFGGNQSNAANVRSFGLDQVRGYRTGAGTGGFVTGTATETDPWNGLRSVTPGANGPLARGFHYQNQQGQTVNHLGMTRGQQIMGGVGAGVGIFSQGVQSGSAGMGAISGALGGYQAAGALGIAGPIGAIAGAGLGLLGGLFGGRAKRRQEHQQKAQAWEQMSPHWEEYQRMLRADSGPASGLRAAYGAIDQQMVDFVRVGSAAWKNGKNNSSALFNQVSQSRVGYQQRTNQAFAGGFDASVRSLNAGQGMESPFIQARDGIVEVGKSLLTFVDDARIVFGDGSEQVQKATEASVAQLRAMVSGSNELTEVGTALEVLAGAGNALGNQLMQLGVSFEDATREVGEAAHLMITRIRGDFVQGIEDQIAALDGKGYLADVRETIAGIDLMLKDAAALNVDRSLVDDLFAKQAQAIVNGAELTGEAFADLITQFPRLAGVVTEFSAAAEEAAKRTADQIAALRLSYDDRVFEAGIDTSTEAGALARFDRYAAREREEEIKAGGDAILDLERALAAERGQILKQFADRAAEETKRAMESAQSFLDGFARNIGSYLDGLRAGPDSPMTGQARVDEARKQFEEQLGLARGGDRDALGSITSYADRLLEADRAYNTSSPAAQATFDEVTRALEGLPKQLKAEDIVAAEIAKAAKDLQETIRQTALDLAARISTDFAKFDANFDGFLTIDELRPHFAGTELELRRIFSEIDLNGDGQISRLEGLLASDGLTRSTLQSAFLLGPNATAGALAPHFARLDTSLDGLLSFDEMRVALGGIATDDQIRQMMTALDTNGDGQLSYLELINANGRVQVGQTQTQATTLAAIERLTVQQLATANWHTQWFDTLAKHITHGTNINQSSQHQGHLLLDRIRANLAEANAGGGLRQFMTGGYTGDMATNAVAGQVHGREFVAHAEATRQYRPFLEQMNAGTFRAPVIPMPVMPQMANDNRAVEAEIKGLRADILRLEKALVSATLAAGENVRDGVDDVADEARKGNRTAERKSRAG